MLRHLLPATLGFAALALPAAAHASALLGSSVTGTITGSSDFVVSTQFTSPAVVGPGVEFTGAVADTSFNYLFNVGADFSDDALVISFSSATPFANVTPVPPGSLAPFTLTFGSANGYFGAIGPVTQITCVKVFGCGNTKIAVGGGASAITVDVSAIFAGDSFKIALSPPAVPEPSVWAMLIVGFGLIGHARRSSAAVRRRLAAC